jgi:hypothetical protein
MNTLRILNITGTMVINLNNQRPCSIKFSKLLKNLFILFILSLDDLSKPFALRGGSYDKKMLLGRAKSKHQNILRHLVD